ncbi:hypothetical protein P0136_00285 [Lentisphaerota bacterium ZTH]|nr:hypothetical protein JYG24_08570 [Lentisphaerota bacterium]WET06454.1 hypothetical protein P0136_00285 [Lentisphaerota bacterium ZTH]
MPKREDIKKILIIGSGPACKFDYSGTQSCKALYEEGYEIVLGNSNPAIIMTDPGMADKTYVAPLTEECIEKIIDKERPDALLPNLGGQTALNLSASLFENGIASETVRNLHEGRPNLREMIKNRNLNLIINTPIGREGKFDDSYIRMLAIQNKVSYVTTLPAAEATVAGSKAVKVENIIPESLQEYHG